MGWTINVRVLVSYSILASDCQLVPRDRTIVHQNKKKRKQHSEEDKVFLDIY